MGNTSQKRALQNYRRRLNARGWPALKFSG